jgi:tetratricopeptide (TPR) repeat protein
MKAPQTCVEESETLVMQKVTALAILLRIGYLIVLCIIPPGCRTPSEPSPKPKSTNVQALSKPAGFERFSKALADFNRGAALLEQYKYVEAAKAFESVLEAAPDWTAARFNLGLAYFNMQEDPGAQSYLERAQAAFETVLQSDPNHLPAQFCLGLYYQHLGENEKALKYFQSVSDADPDDPYVLYKCAETLINLGRNDEGIAMLEKVIDLDPGFVSGAYRLATQYQRTRQRDKAMPLFARFKELKETELTGGSFTVLKAYGTVGKYYMALGSDNLPMKSTTERDQRRIIFSPN